MSIPSVDPIPLCVDLDGTVIKTDLLYESVLLLIKNKPSVALRLPLWLKEGRAYLKRQIASQVELSLDTLPINEEVVAYLRAQKEAGRKIILVTASDHLLATKFAEKVGVFDDVIGSDGETNYKGEGKLRKLISLFGEKGFDYVGDSQADIHVWRGARKAIVVSSQNAPLTAATRDLFPDAEYIVSERLKRRSYLKALRVHQWVKNLLVFLPLVMAHRVQEPMLILMATCAFFAFSACASAVYLINDLLDLESDRLHPYKRRRPFASGALPILHGIFLVPVLLFTALIVGAALGIEFLAVLAGYFAITFGYSLRFKQIVLVDILVLASLYTVRMIAGGVAVGVEVSPWLLAFSMFFFYSLAAVKRFSELYSARKREKKSLAGRGYRAEDLEFMAAMGNGAGFTSVLVLALYVTSNDVTALYSKPQYLLLICPLLMYWISRIWLLAHRGELHDDPIVFAITDRVSYIVGAISGLVLLIAV